MFKDFEDFWKNSNILDTDSYRCIAETYQFNKDNIPQAFESFGRNCFTSGQTNAFDLGKRYGRGEMIETMLAFLDMIKTADDAKVMKEMIETIENTYKTKIKEDKYGFALEKI